MNTIRVTLIAVMALVLALPLVMRPEERERVAENAATLVVITPHVEQIRVEFGEGFSRWHDEHFGQPVAVDWRRPGGTSEIRKLLQDQYRAALRRGDIADDGACPSGQMPYDLLFGGGSYEHEQIKKGVTVIREEPGTSRSVTVPISESAGFDQARLDEWFGENLVGAEPLYDPEQFWLGSALSSFGILCNRDLLERFGLPEPTGWEDLTDPRYTGWLLLGDPRQSGSIATNYESVMKAYGWDRGWRILRALCANTRSFANNSAKVVIDVGQGEAAAGVAIDFYGRFQAEMLIPPGGVPSDSRLAFVEPAGVVYVNTDPISILRGGPNPVIARRFLEFVLSERGQAILQFAPVGDDAPPDALGPRQYALRRMPVRRWMYEKHFDRFIDPVNLFEIAMRDPGDGWRSLLGPIFATAAIEVHRDLRAAWDALNDARAAGAPAALLDELETLFYAFPTHVTADGTPLEFAPENYDAIKHEWRDRRREPTLRIEYAAFFRGNYREIVRRARAAGYG